MNIKKGYCDKRFLPRIFVFKETPSFLVEWAVFLIFYVKKLLFVLIIENKIA